MKFFKCTLLAILAAVGIAAFLAMTSGLSILIILSILSIGQIILEYVFAFTAAPDNEIAQLVSAGSFFRSFILFAGGSIACAIMAKLMDLKKVGEFFSEET